MSAKLTIAESDAVNEENKCSGGSDSQVNCGLTIWSGSTGIGSDAPHEPTPQLLLFVSLTARERRGHTP